MVIDKLLIRLDVGCFFVGFLMAMYGIRSRRVLTAAVSLLNRIYLHEFEHFAIIDGRNSLLLWPNVVHVRSVKSIPIPFILSPTLFNIFKRDSFDQVQMKIVSTWWCYGIYVTVWLYIDQFVIMITNEVRVRLELYFISKSSLFIFQIYQ